MFHFVVGFFFLRISGRYNAKCNDKHPSLRSQTHAYHACYLYYIYTPFRVTADSFREILRGTPGIWKFAQWVISATFITKQMENYTTFIHLTGHQHQTLTSQTLKTGKCCDAVTQVHIPATQYSILQYVHCKLSLRPRKIIITSLLPQRPWLYIYEVIVAMLWCKSCDTQNANFQNIMVLQLYDPSDKLSNFPSHTQPLGFLVSI